VRKANLLVYVFSGFVFLLAPQPSWADKITTDIVKSYKLYGSSVEFATLEALKANWNAADQQQFDKCMAVGAIRGYWDCYLHKIVGDAHGHITQGTLTANQIRMG